MLQTVTKDNQLFAVTEKGEVRAYTKKQAMSIIGLPADQNPRMRKLVMSNKIHFIGYKAQKDGSKVPEALYDAADVDKYRDDYRPRGEGSGHVFEIRIEPATLKLATKCVDDHKALDEGGQEAVDALNELVSALLQAIDKTEERRAYNDIRKAQAK